MAIVDLGEQLRSSGAFANTGFNRFAAVSHVMESIRDPNRWVGVAEHDGKIVGFLMLVAQPYWWNPSAWQVLDDVIYCARAGMGRALIRAGLKWAWSMPQVVDVIISLNNGNAEQFVPALRRAGLERRGIAMGASKTRRTQRWVA